MIRIFTNSDYIGHADSEHVNYKDAIGSFSSTVPL